MKFSIAVFASLVSTLLAGPTAAQESLHGVSFTPQLRYPLANSALVSDAGFYGLTLEIPFSGAWALIADGHVRAMPIIDVICTSSPCGPTPVHLGAGANLGLSLRPWPSAALNPFLSASAGQTRWILDSERGMSPAVSVRGGIDLQFPRVPLSLRVDLSRTVVWTPVYPDDPARVNLLSAGIRLDRRLLQVLRGRPAA